MKTKDEDFVEQLFLTKAHDTLMAFTDRGYVYASRSTICPRWPPTPGASTSRT